MIGPLGGASSESSLSTRDWSKVTTDKAKSLIGAVQDVLPDVEHDTPVYANNRVECDHGRRAEPSHAQAIGSLARSLLVRAQACLLILP